jgi:hypothetical protein
VGDLEQLKRILFVITVLVSTSSLAQKYIGISGGLVNNVIVGGEADFQKKIHNNPFSSRTGPTFSVLLKRELPSLFYLKGEFAYIRKGNYSPNNQLWNLNLGYFSLPLKLGFQPVTTRLFKFAIEMGASLNYNPGHETDQLAAAYAEVRKAAVSTLFGGNVEYRLSETRSLFFNTTWYYDVTPLVSYENGNATYRAMNRGWMFTVGLLRTLH